MKLLQRDLYVLLLSVLLVSIGLVIADSKLAIVITLILAILAFRAKHQGILILVLVVATRPFLIELNPGFKILGDLLILALLVRTFYDYRHDIKKLFTFHPFELAFFAFCIVGTISALITGVGMGALITQLRAYLLFYLIFYIVVRMEITEELIRKFALTTFSIAVVLSLHGFVEKISNKTVLMPEAWENWYLSWTNYIRVYGLLKGPNELSLFLLISFFISLYLVKKYQGKIRIFLYVGLTLIGTTILLTYSRGSLLSLIVFLVVYVFINRKIKPLVPIVLITLISYGLFFVIDQVSSVYYDAYVAEKWENTNEQNKTDEQGRYKDTFSKDTLEQSSESGRIYYVQKAVEIFKDHPIMGTGFATFGGSATLKYSSPIYEDYDINRNFYSDNQYILILAETGILGILMVALTAIFLLTYTWKLRKGYYFSPLLLFLMVTIVMGSMVYNILENDSFMFYFFAVMAFAYRVYKKDIVGLDTK
ncbi:O-antigen ligase family protein [Bacillus timonensis]|nr:O-antigen ligase family protein [Bacillus timonensis]